MKTWNVKITFGGIIDRQIMHPAFTKEEVAADLKREVEARLFSSFTGDIGANVEVTAEEITVP